MWTVELSVKSNKNYIKTITADCDVSPQSLRHPLLISSKWIVGLTECEYRRCHCIFGGISLLLNPPTLGTWAIDVAPVPKYCFNVETNCFMVWRELNHAIGWTNPDDRLSILNRWWGGFHLIRLEIFIWNGKQKESKSETRIAILFIFTLFIG